MGVLGRVLRVHLGGHLVEAGAVQCGVCTPGLIMATHDLLERHPVPSEMQIREELSGNVCRCTGYGRIIDAVQRVAVARRDQADAGAVS
ncbi:MAG TPA: 2Fe-2S iron-sulfur cluster-binding protein [Ilumatobacteraceae bacterium]|nr:2Fe-2S iron-sulfur cluster-binding protein [Ilumatobacteraceae bacterium]